MKPITLHPKQHGRLFPLFYKYQPILCRSEIVVFTVLRLHADEHGLCNVSTVRIIRLSDYSKRQVRRAINFLMGNAYRQMDKSLIKRFSHLKLKTKQDVRGGNIVTLACLPDSDPLILTRMASENSFIYSLR